MGEIYGVHGATRRFDRETFKRFKRAYKDALAHCPGESFMFQGDEYLKTYAGYVIEYLTVMFNGR